MKPSIKIFLVLLALMLPALLVGLEGRPVYKIQEIRIAETAREMLASGDWLVPRYNGDLRLQKPPLPYWLTAASYSALGVNALATRLPAVLFGLLSAALVWFWLRREIGLKAASNGALLLVVSYLGLRYFRSGEADSVLLFFVSAATILSYGILCGQAGGWRRALFGLALGLGFLSKGPAALAIPLLTLLVSGVLGKRAGRMSPPVRSFFSVPGVVLLLVAAFGWYALILWKFPEIAQQFFGRQVDETFVSGTHQKPVWWYLAHAFEFFAPWGVLLIPAGWMAFRQRRDDLPSVVRFAWVWLAVVFVLLTLTVNKQMQYALLFAPPVAIILGHYLAVAQGGFARVNRFLFVMFCVAAAVGIVIALRKSNDITHALVWLAVPVVPLALQRLLRERQLSTPVLFVAGMTAMVVLYGEAYLSKEPHKVAAQALMAEAATYPQVYQFRTALNNGALSFYAGRVIPPVRAEEIEELLQRQPEIFVIGEGEPPQMSGLSLRVVRQVEDLILYRVRLGEGS